MKPDDEMLMAYADGELDPLNVKRVERAMADDPAIAAAVEQHRALRKALTHRFAPMLHEPVPDHLAAMLKSNVVQFTPPPAPATQPPWRWLSGLAVAASLVAGITVGTQWQGEPGSVTSKNGSLIASGPLARTLDTQLASAAGDTRILASFQAQGGGYCRTFASPSFDGIACKRNEGWQLRQTRAADTARGTDYRQAGSGNAAIMAAAQDMMAGDPLDAAGEKAAAAKGWK